MSQSQSDKEKCRNAVLLVFAIYLFFNLLAAAYLSHRLDVRLGPHYGAIYMLIARARQQLSLTVVGVNLISFLFTAVGVSLLGILFSHRIAGPMVRIKLFADQLSEGDFENRPSLRKNDAIKNLLASLTGVAQEFSAKTIQLETDLEHMENTLNRLKTGLTDATETEELIRSLHETNTSIGGLLRDSCDI